MGTGHIDALVIGHSAAVEHLADDGFLGHFLHAHADKTVVNQDGVAGLDVLGQVLIRNAAAFLGAHAFVGIQCEILSIFQRDAAALKVSGTDFRTFGIEHGGDGQTQIFTHADNLFEANQVFFMVGVTEIEACHIHACTHKRFEKVFIKESGTHCTHDLRSSAHTVTFRFVFFHDTPFQAKNLQNAEQGSRNEKQFYPFGG